MTDTPGKMEFDNETDATYFAIGRLKEHWITHLYPVMDNFQVVKYVCQWWCQ